MRTTGAGAWPVRIDGGSPQVDDSSPARRDDLAHALCCGSTVSEPADRSGDEPAGAHAETWPVRETDVFSKVDDRSARDLGSTSDRRVAGMPCTSVGVWPVHWGGTSPAGSGLRGATGRGQAVDLPDAGAAVPPTGGSGTSSQARNHSVRARGPARVSTSAGSRCVPGSSATGAGMWPVRADPGFARAGDHGSVRADGVRGRRAGGTRKSVRLRGVVSRAVRVIAKETRSKWLWGRGRRGGSEPAVVLPADQVSSPSTGSSVCLCTASPGEEAGGPDRSDVQVGGPGRSGVGAGAPDCPDGEVGGPNRSGEEINGPDRPGAGIVGPDHQVEFAIDVAFAEAEAVPAGGLAQGTAPDLTMVQGSAPPSSAGEVALVSEAGSTRNSQRCHATGRHGGSDGGRTALLRGGGADASRGGRSAALSAVVRCGRCARGATDTGDLGCGNRVGVHGLRVGSRDGAGGADGGRHRRGTESARSW